MGIPFDRNPVPVLKNSSSRVIHGLESFKQLETGQLQKNVKEVQQFVGYAQSNRCFINNFLGMIAPITKLRDNFSLVSSSKGCFSCLKQGSQQPLYWLILYLN